MQVDKLTEMLRSNVVPAISVTNSVILSMQ